MERPLSPLGATFRRSLIRKNDEMTIEEIGKRLKKYGNVWVIKYLQHMHTLDVLFSAKNAVGAKIVVDIDDNIWQIPVGNIARGTESENAHRAFMLTESVQCADYVTVSTSPLKTALKDLNENITVLKNLIDPDEWKTPRKKHKKVRIGWVYSPTHYPDKVVIEDALKEISKREDTEIVIFGATMNIFDFPTTNIAAVRFDEYPKLFRSEGIDISVGPLQKNEFNECKSNIKWLESTLAGAAFIGSNVFPYKDSIQHGQTGYIAKNTDDWVKRLTWLIEHPEKRKELVENAKKVVLRDYNVKTNKDWEDFYGSL